MDLGLEAVEASGRADDDWQVRVAGEGVGTIAGAFGAMLRN